MDRDAGESDRRDEALQGDTGMIGSESEEPGPGRDTSLTDPDPVAASTDQPRGPVAMSEGDPMRTRLGSHVEGAGVIGYDVAAAEEGATQQTPAEDRPGYASERLPSGEEPIDEPSVVATPSTAATAPTDYERDPGLGATEAGLAGGATGVGVAGPGVAAAGNEVDDAGPTDRSLFAEERPGPERSRFATEGGGGPGMAGYEGEPGGAGLAGYEGEPGGDLPATYTGEETDVTGRPEYADRTEGSDRPLYQEEPQRMDRPGGGGSLFSDEVPERLDRPGPQEPGVDQGVYDQEADQAREQRPSDGR